MTRDQQLQELGIGVDAYEGLIQVEMELPITTLTLDEARRVFVFFERAYRDALTRDRKVEVEA